MMGVKYGREYDEIISDLMNAINEIDYFFEFFEMNDQDWYDLEREEQKGCLRTLADDIIYGLGETPTLNVSNGTVYYDHDRHVITVFDGDNCTHIVNLV